MDRGSLLHPQRDPARAWRPGADLHRFGRRSAVECASVDGHVVGGNSVHTAFKAKPPDASDGFEAGIGEQSSRASTKATRRGPGPARDGVRGGAAASSPRTRIRILRRPGGRRARRRQLPRRAGPGRWQQLGNTTPGDSRKPEGGEDGDLPVNQAAPRRGPQATIPTHNPLDGGSNPPRPISGKPRSERGSPPSGTQSLAPRSADWATPPGGFEGGNRQMRKNRVSLDLKDHVCRRRFSGERADRPTATDRQPACRAGPSFPRANLEYRTACPSSR